MGNITGKELFTELEIDIKDYKITHLDNLQFLSLDKMTVAVQTPSIETATASFEMLWHLRSRQLHYYHHGSVSDAFFELVFRCLNFRVFGFGFQGGRTLRAKELRLKLGTGVPGQVAFDERYFYVQSF